MQEEINKEVLKRVDFDAVAYNVMKSEEIYEAIRAKIVKDYTDDLRVRSSVEREIQHELVKKFLDEHAAEIISQIDVKAILNAVTLKIAVAVKDKLNE